jgi:hypothetical protein
MYKYLSIYLGIIFLQDFVNTKNVWINFFVI